MDLRNAALKRIPINQIILILLIAASVVGAITLVAQSLSFQKERYSLQEILNLTRAESLKLKQELKSTKQELESTQQELESIRQKLGLYNQALKEREDLQAELTELRATLSSTQDLLTQAKADKDILAKDAKKFGQELKFLQDQTRLLEGKIEGLDEIKLTLQTRIQSLRELRGRIRNFKREAFLNKVKAQKEIDRIKLEKGNRGFVKKDGQSTLNAQRMIELEKIIIRAKPEETKSEEK